MDTKVRDMRNVPLAVGDQVATATISRLAGAGLRVGTIVRFIGANDMELRLDSGRQVGRQGREVVKVATC